LGNVGAGGGGGGGAGGRGRKTKDRSDPLKDWVPTTKLGRLVESGTITTFEQIYHFSLPIKEWQIVDALCKRNESTLKDEVLKIMPVQKQTPSGQRTRFKAFVVVGDHAGHVGLGVKCSKEVATAIRGGIIQAKLSMVPVRMGYWGNKIGAPHTVPTKVTGKCGSVMVRLVPAPRGTGIVAAKVSKKMIEFAGIEDVFTASNGHTKTLGNFAKATFAAIKQTYQYMTPDLWRVEPFLLDPFEEHSEELHEHADTKKGKQEKGKQEKGKQERQERQERQDKGKQ